MRGSRRVHLEAIGATRLSNGRQGLVCRAQTRETARRPLPRRRQSATIVVTHGLDDLEIDLEFGLGPRGSHDDARVVHEIPAQTLGRRETAITTGEVVDPRHLDARYLRKWFCP